MENQIKVGQSCEVITCENYIISPKYKQHCGVILGFNIYLHVTIFGAWEPREHDMFGQKVALLQEHEVKRIGKLTITKVK
ncbi:hypothetical protein [Sphingobacterium sp. UBA2074]|uniref:hypothetical protein n=1 Tax=Sphingobacterium sp. UBA2074 TaxID=1947487 RepID=UPI00257A9C25|nr:hypothetical protein [Sphingobacterium sp. UBA2074]